MPDNFVEIAHKMLIDQYITEWFIELQTSQKLSMYKHFKLIFHHEQYLVDVRNYKYRRALARFRMSAHNLEIEIGRYPPHRERHLGLCQYCDGQFIEDEYHFLFVCSFYVHLRRKYIPNYYWRRPNMMKFVDYVSDCNHALYLGKYLYHASRYRDNVNDV